MVTEQELSELSEEYFKLLNSPYCNFCGTFDVYVDTSHIDYNSRDSWPILRNTSDNEPHHCVVLEYGGSWIILPGKIF